MIYLIPYEEKFVDVIRHFYNGKEYSHYNRNARCWFNTEECLNIEEITKHKHFIVFRDESIIGIVPYMIDVGIFRWGIAINKEYWGKKYFKEVLDELEEFAKNKTGCRMMYGETLVIDNHLTDFLVRNGHIKAGVIEQYIFCDGKYEDVNIIYKRIL